MFICGIKNFTIAIMFLDICSIKHATDTKKRALRTDISWNKSKAKKADAAHIKKNKILKILPRKALSPDNLTIVRNPHLDKAATERTKIG